MSIIPQNICDAAQKNNSSILDFEELDREHGPTIKRYINRKLWNKQNIDDVYQTVLLEAIKSSHTFNQQCHPKFWLMGIVNNVIKNLARKENSVFFSIEASDYSNTLYDIIQEQAEDPADLHEREQFHEAIEDACHNLPKKMKVVMFELINNGKSYAEVAEDLNIAVGTVRSRIHRARDIIRFRVNTAYNI